MTSEMTGAGQRTGTTVVEVMVGVVAAAMLLLTLGSMLFYSYRGWRIMQSAAEMERDGALAMRTLCRVFRSGSGTNVWVVSPSSVTVSNASDIAAQSFYLTQARLVYAVDDVPRLDLVRTGVVEFACSAVISNGVTLVLRLNEPLGGTTMAMTNRVALRN